MPVPQSEQGPRYRLLGVMPREIEAQHKQEPEDTVFTWPHFLVRHAVVAGATVAVVFVLAILFNAPLKDMASPNLTPPVAKAPWYFDGLQELLAHYQPMVAGVLVPVAVVTFLVLLPYLDRGGEGGLSTSKLVIIMFTFLVIAIVVFTLIGALFRGPEWSWTWPWHHLFLEL
jgi:menaquinol-cytochrome c reductase cytochrome b/c subunit